VENSPTINVRGIRAIYGAMAELGYDAVGGIVSAADAIWFDCHPEIPEIYHERKRKWMLFADADQGISDKRNNSLAQREITCCEDGDVLQERLQGHRKITARENGRETGRSTSATSWWTTEPGMVRMVHGLPYRVDRVAALGNAQVPAVAALAWEILSEMKGVS
jgi:DNA (cytosine-5)-methyltransferase 1